MTVRLTSPLAIAGLAVAFWIVPSVGTQGMGTIGQRFGHPDSVLIEGRGEPAAPAIRAVLQFADAEAESALGF